jgi:hypothetical protein
MVSVHCSTLACTKFNEQIKLYSYLDNIIPCVHASRVFPTWVLPLVWPALKLCCMLDIFPWVICKLDFLIWDSNVSVLRLYTHCACSECTYIATGEWGRGGGNISLRAGFPAFEVEFEGLCWFARLIDPYDPLRREKYGSSHFGWLSAIHFYISGYIYTFLNKITY